MYNIKILLHSYNNEFFQPKDTYRETCFNYPLKKIKLYTE